MHTKKIVLLSMHPKKFGCYFSLCSIEIRFSNECKKWNNLWKYALLGKFPLPVIFV